MNASVLKVKLATAIIGISSIHLLKTFINAANYDDKVLMWQTIIHVAFLLSALAIALTDRLMTPVHGDGPATDDRFRLDWRRLRLGQQQIAAPSTPDNSEPHSTPSLTWVA